MRAANTYILEMSMDISHDSCAHHLHSESIDAARSQCPGGRERSAAAGETFTFSSVMRAARRIRHPGSSFRTWFYLVAPSTEYASENVVVGWAFACAIRHGYMNIYFTSIALYVLYSGKMRRSSAQIFCLCASNNKTIIRRCRLCVCTSIHMPAYAAYI